MPHGYAGSNPAPSTMTEMDEQQKENAKRASVEFARFWGILARPRQASVEDVIWANDYFDANFANYKDLVTLAVDQEEAAILELVFLGLYHLGYELPVEFKYIRPDRN